jgi:adenylate cyclase, class 2
MIEREVKIRVEDLAGLRPLLEAMDAGREGDEHEVNRIFDTADHMLQHRQQVLRVRTANAATFTWKGPAARDDQHGHKAREELEVRVTAQDAETLVALLQRLGFQEAVRYEKDRETWRWQGLTIALDRLSFGTFVELEGDAELIEQALRALKLERLPFESRGYADLQREADGA